MAIVSENNVSTALRYLSEDPHPVALARKDKTDADNYYAQVYAAVYLEMTGP